MLYYYSIKCKVRNNHKCNVEETISVSLLMHKEDVTQRSYGYLHIMQQRNDHCKVVPLQGNDVTYNDP